MAEEKSTGEQQPEASQAMGQTPPGAQQKNGVVFATKRIYIKDLSFESPLGYAAFAATEQMNPKVNQDLNTQVDRVGEDLYEVVLKLTVTLKLTEEKTAFLAEVHQAGVFEVKGVPPQHLQPLLTATCPQVLFPYVRETIDTLAVKGGFSPLYLPHINFDALYAQAVAEARSRQQNQQKESNNAG